MNIHEYQAKEILKHYQVPVLSGLVAHSSQEAVQVAEKIGGEKWVVKAQIHAGGRGKGGGVKLASSLKEVESLSQQIIGMNLVTPQTDKEGKKVHKVLVESGCDIEKEYYLAFLLDRKAGQVVFMASSEGGMDIEEVALKEPSKICRIFIDPATGMMPFHGRQMAFFLGFKGELLKPALLTFKALYNAFVKTDSTLLEINPLVRTKQNQIVALDAKMNFDDNALFRQPQIVEYRDLTEENESEIEAKKYDLAFIPLNGSIGCMVNGAGLAMATMDIIKLYGGSPANFLDVGGGASQEKVQAALKIILKDTNVQGVLVNIFGGIMKCDVIAKGLVSACEEVGIQVPLVVRLEGTHVKKGEQILRESSLNIIPAETLKEAAEKITEAVGETNVSQ